ncbi:MAG: hypothetical protein WAM82_17230 [Thermoanaerobaculia bacterium]
MPAPRSPAAALSSLAWANVVFHLVGIGFAWIGMRPGSVAVPAAERLAYVAGRPAGWVWGWGVWMVCSLLLVAFMAVLRRRLPASSAADLALILAASGMAVDLFCDGIQIQALPLAAAGGNRTLFFALERLAFTGGAAIANGLYTASVMLMTLCLRTSRRSTRVLGWATGISGAAMVVSGFLLSPALLLASTGPTIGFYSLWTLRVARDLRQDRP